MDLIPTDLLNVFARHTLCSCDRNIKTKSVQTYGST